MTEYVDHVRLGSADAERRFETTTLGSGAAMKHKALTLLPDRAPVASVRTPVRPTPTGSLLDDVLAATA
jgi:hypothetical protein